LNDLREEWTAWQGSDEWACSRSLWFAEPLIAVLTWSPQIPQGLTCDAKSFQICNRATEHKIIIKQSYQEKLTAT
jgi:hypothetical protein